MWSQKGVVSLLSSLFIKPTGIQRFIELPDGPDLQVVNVVTARSAINADHGTGGRCFDVAKFF
jgi:hypothetical protein